MAERQQDQMPDMCPLDHRQYVTSPPYNLLLLLEMPGAFLSLVVLIESTHGFREGRMVSFYNCLRQFGLEWFASPTFFDHKKTTGQLLWIDLALAQLSGQELRNSYTITGSPEFAPLRKFFRGATHQLDCLYTGKPNSLRPQDRMLSLFDQIRTDIDSHTGVVTSSTTSTPDNKSPTTHRRGHYAATPHYE